MNAIMLWFESSLKWCLFFFLFRDLQFAAPKHGIFTAKKKWAMLGLEHWKFPAVDLRRGEEHNILLTGCIAHNNETVNC